MSGSKLLNSSVDQFILRQQNYRSPFENSISIPQKYEKRNDSIYELPSY